jgi:hypothetical protein
MELMETSLDILYKLVYGKLGQAIPEDILGVVALAVSIFSHLQRSNPLRTMHCILPSFIILLCLTGKLFNFYFLGCQSAGLFKVEPKYNT